MSSVESLAGLEGRSLRAVHLEVEQGRVVLDLVGTRVCFEGVISSTLLGPWDGRPARVEWLRLVHRDPEQCCFELRVQYEEVPRVYRLVCLGWTLEET